jgi:hypothetical protein
VIKQGGLVRRKNVGQIRLTKWWSYNTNKVVVRQDKQNGGLVRLKNVGQLRLKMLVN